MPSLSHYKYVYRYIYFIKDDKGFSFPVCKSFLTVLYIQTLLPILLAFIKYVSLFLTECVDFYVCIKREGNVSFLFSKYGQHILAVFIVDVIGG